jgi:nicotinamidase-related amidase
VHDLLDRTGWSAFTGTALDQVLRRRGVRNLILCGATTEGAVHATTREANDRGYEALLVEDATASLVPAHHAAILRITRFGSGLFGTTAPVAALLAALEGTSA